MGVREVLSSIRLAGRPKAVGEGKVQEIDGLSPLGTAARIEELTQLSSLVTQWKLQAVNAYKKRLRG